MPADPAFIELAIELATRNVRECKGGPFGCVVVKDGRIVATGVNAVTENNDPTAHAEVQAIRNACRELGSFQLEGCEIYTSCEPCPMCLGAIYWARPSAVYYANTHQDAADAGFDDSFIYREIATPPEQRSVPMTRITGTHAIESFDLWRTTHSRVEY